MKLFSFLTAILLTSTVFANDMGVYDEETDGGGRGRNNRVCFFEHANFEGRSFCLFPGQRINNLDNTGFNDTISSIRVRGNATVVVFEHANFSGDRFRVNNNVRDFSNHRRGGGESWNDTISSIRVR